MLPQNEVFFLFVSMLVTGGKNLLIIFLTKMKTIILMLVLAVKVISQEEDYDE